MALKQDIGLPCLNCSNCSGFKIHGWRKICTECICSVEQHDISDDSSLPILDELKLTDKLFYNNYKDSLNMAEKLNKAWLPSGIAHAEVETFLNNFPENLEKPIGEKVRKKKIRLQIPVQDRCVEKFCHLDTAAERQEAEKFLSHRNNREIGVGYVTKLGERQSVICMFCNIDINPGSLIVNSDIYQQTLNSSNVSSNAGTASAINAHKAAWHPACFKCETCQEILVDYVHVVNDTKLFCVRHHSQSLRPRCNACDELIFSTEFVKNNSTESYHLKHFACALCDSSLAKNRYLQMDDHKFNITRNICVTCYDTKLANKCTSCSDPIKSDARDISYRSLHWHPKCFKCNQCSKSLEGESFGFWPNSKEKIQGNVDKLLCAECYKEMVVPKCYACSKPAEYDKKIVVLADKSWHYECFQCFKCKKSIGSENFVETTGGNVCSVCYDKEYAKKCSFCTKIIKEIGVTFKDKSYHYECFTCTNCKAKLSDVKFSVKNNKFYCKSCNDNQFAHKCCKCSNVITGDMSVNYIKFQDKCWHTTCFNCMKCNDTLVEKPFMTKEKEILCSQCGILSN